MVWGKVFSLLGSRNLQLGREGRREGRKQRKRGVEIEMETERQRRRDGGSQALVQESTEI